MHFGLNLFPIVGPVDKPAHEYYDEVLRLSVLAEELGYHHVKVVEHHLTPYGGYSPDPVALLSAVAARTTRIRLVTGAVIPAFCHPVQLAARLAQLDNLSRGRLDVGFGRAFLPHEFAAFEIPMNESRERFRAGTEACLRLWTEQDVVWTGGFHRFGPATILPRPFQHPHPPTLVAVSFSPQSAQEAGNGGHDLMLVPAVLETDQVRALLEIHREAWVGSGRAPGTDRPHLTYMCYLSQDRDEALTIARGHEARYLAALLDATRTLTGMSHAQYPGYEHLRDRLQRLDFDDALRAGKVLAGTPRDVVAQVESIRDRFGDGVVLSLVVNSGPLSYDVGARTLRLFADHVAPALATEPAPSSVSR